MMEDHNNGIENKGKPKWPRIAIAIALLLLISVSAVFAFRGNLFMSDEERLIEAAKNTQWATRKAVVGEIGFDEFTVQGIGVMEGAVIENIVKGLKLEYEMTMDADAYRVEGTMGVVLNGSDLVDVVFHMNSDYIAFGIPALYDQVFYLDWEDLKDVLVRYGAASEEDLPVIDAERVIELLDAYTTALDFREYEAYGNLDQEMYDGLLYGILTDSIRNVEKSTLEMEVADINYSLGGRVYNLDIAMDEYMNKSTALFEALLQDENLLPMIREGVERIVAAVIEKQDYMMYNMLASMDSGIMVEVWDDSLADALEGKKEAFLEELDASYEEYLTEMRKSMEEPEYVQAQELIADIYSEIDMDAAMVIHDGYIMGARASSESMIPYWMLLLTLPTGTPPAIWIWQV